MNNTLHKAQTVDTHQAIRKVFTRVGFDQNINSSKIETHAKHIGR